MALRANMKVPERPLGFIYLQTFLRISFDVQSIPTVVTLRYHSRFLSPSVKCERQLGLVPSPCPSLSEPPPAPHPAATSTPPTAPYIHFLSHSLSVIIPIPSLRRHAPEQQTRIIRIQPPYLPAMLRSRRRRARMAVCCVRSIAA